MPVNSDSIYHQYLLDHFMIKQGFMREVILDFDKYSTVWDGYLTVDKEKVLRSLKLEMKTTLYLGIETLFQLIFALEPINNQLRDKDLWKNLSIKNQGLTEKIDKYADDEYEFVESVIVNKEDIPFLQHVFYFASLGFNNQKKVTESIAVIEKGLKLLAIEFKDRGVYNSYKHGLRLFQTLKKFEISDSDKKDVIESFDGSDSISFLEKNKNEGDSFLFRINTLDFERDFNLTYFVSILISNLILSRKTSITKKEETFYFLQEDFLTHLSERNIKWDKFKMKVKLP